MIVKYKMPLGEVVKELFDSVRAELMRHVILNIHRMKDTIEVASNISPTFQ